MRSEIVKMLWFLGVAGVANMAPVFAAKLWPKWDWPINGILFGSHKTWRGLVFGVGIAGIVGGGLGALSGFGALMGDLVKSFCKRRMGIAPGKSWFPWDQIDWVVGTMVMSWPVVRWTIWEVAALVFLGLGLHLLVKVIGYVIKVNESYI
ncbi:hypothetical protein A2899_02445 [Candidatus Amesbacteria bacterium RIFCSPLOWO2_01_FULL_49_25]|uniref:CDP-archaeol synthase n=1 Tax=Candidatus Amesbacteria bacterium RIFCSPHIGHO2_01_FULL_48_32b TaxID=1797253 RepID=A0A1F4YGV0_9BACT|nr:MAG: hypothetical protein A2876_04175 [Candidatus Amesbacteria bacterium RIFCSPHIGHO2_01_FULL_48_32b]OGD08596.1 MAG: hypothetical protein A2899_02445 [Candidatus Amesbacteria bacterium RIFCSPLOWO2_01_FULL_49_25]